MNNPWNTQMEVDFDDDIKREILVWYNKIIKLPLYLRREGCVKNPLDKKCRKYLKSIYNKGYGFKIIARW